MMPMQPDHSPNGRGWDNISYIYINGEWKAFSNIKVYNGSSWEDV